MFKTLAADRPDLHILITGMGRNRAESSVGTFLKSCCPLLVLTCGFAGGLNPKLGIGDVLFATEDASLAEKLSRAGARIAKFYFASSAIVSASEKAELRRATGADAVEMESAAIQAVCGALGISCATVRVISDSANEDLPLDFNRLLSPDLNLSYAKLAWALAKSPGKTPALLRLQKNCRFAATRLADVLAKVMELKSPPLE